MVFGTQIPLLGAPRKPQEKAFLYRWANHLVCTGAGGIPRAIKAGYWLGRMSGTLSRPAP
ncbi:hypothetical protein ASAP_2305 [Asaia bogorensis]|uniref:Uncharacterized protein n=1 Tax=Asaia bogorensis TaxID=91915 RepID=A0A060QHD0_9PROT|nr:hypothetical protein ASAP_2305 [Asaia bogorensis]